LHKVLKNLSKFRRLRYQCCIKIKKFCFIFKNLIQTKKLGWVGLLISMQQQFVSMVTILDFEKLKKVVLEQYEGVKISKFVFCR